MQRFVQTLELVDDPEMIAAYRKAHSSGEIWPEITAGIKEVGVTRMDIYLEGTRLVMILELPDAVDRDAAFARLATLPRQQEWEEFVGKYQVCNPGDTSAGKWRQMDQIFHLPE